MLFHLGWSAESKDWIKTIPQRLYVGLHESGKVGVNDAADKIIARAKENVPHFEGWLRDAIKSHSEVDNIGGAMEYSLSVGLTGNAHMVDESDVWDDSTRPFSYGAAKHTPAAKKHRVWLFNPDTGGTTKNRQKLVRYLKSKGGIWSDLPAAPTKEYWENTKGKKNVPPPFVNVTPSKSATDYLASSFDLSHGGWVAAIVFKNVYPRVKRVWRE